MSDPIARYYELVIRDELNRQNDATERSIDITEVNIRALARALTQRHGKPPSALADKLELAAVQDADARAHPVGDMAAISMAISMKRIADVLEEKHS